MGNQRGLLNVSDDHVYDGAHIIFQQVILVVGDIRLQVLKNSVLAHEDHHEKATIVVHKSIVNQKRDSGSSFL